MKPSAIFGQLIEMYFSARGDQFKFSSDSDVMNARARRDANQGLLGRRRPEGESEESGESEVNIQTPSDSSSESRNVLGSPCKLNIAIQFKHKINSCYNWEACSLTVRPQREALGINLAEASEDRFTDSYVKSNRKMLKEKFTALAAAKTAQQYREQCMVKCEKYKTRAEAYRKDIQAFNMRAGLLALMVRLPHS